MGTASGLPVTEVESVLREVVGALGNSLPALLSLARSGKPSQGNDGQDSGK